MASQGIDADRVIPVTFGGNRSSSESNVVDHRNRIGILMVNYQDGFFASMTRAILEKPFFPSPTFA
jgi:hypothetical protein